MLGGTRDLVRATTAYVACLTFALTYLLTTLLGGDGMTAVIRATVVAIVTLALGSFLFRPVLSTIFDAMARDQAVTKPEGDE